MDDRDADAVEDGGDRERHARQSRRLFAWAAVVFLVAIIVAVLLLFRSIPGTSAFEGYPTPVPTNGWYRVAEGRSLGEAWVVEFANPGPCIRIRVGTEERTLDELCGFELTESAPWIIQAAGHESGGERDVLLFGAVVPSIGSIELVADDRAVETVLSDPEPSLQLNMRFFAAVIGLPDRLEISIRDRAGEIVFHEEGDNPYRDA